MPALTRYATNLRNPQSIAFDSSGNLYVANFDANDVVKIPSASGGTVGGAATVIASGQGANWVAVDSSNNVFTIFACKSVIYKNNNVWFTDNKLREATDIACDSAGNVYVSTLRNEILRISAS